jgi:hypothetical protein
MPQANWRIELGTDSGGISLYVMDGMSDLTFLARRRIRSGSPIITMVQPAQSSL